MAIGEPTRHVDWRALTDGTARFAADRTLEGELVGVVLRSPHPHARITRLDVDAARKLPGVHAVLTAADVTDRMYLDYRVIDQDRRVLASDTVRYIGEPVALVAAETAETARAALAAIRVRYRVLPTLDTVAKAIAPAALQIHRGREGNVAHDVHRSFGDPGAAARAAHVVRRTYHSSRQSHATMEPHTVLAHWRPDEGCLHVWAPSQNLRTLQQDLAQLFGLELSAVRLHEMAVGGDFGGRTQISSTEALVCALSLATAQPVRLSQSREEEFAFTKWRLSWDIDLEVGCDDAGRVTHLSSTFDVDNGAYNQAGPGEMVYGSVALGSSYRWRSYEADGRCVYTTKVPASSFRGAGGYAVSWSLECAIDELADAAGVDPIDFRLLNAVADEGETSLTGWRVKSSGLHACLETVRREIDWDRKRQLGGTGRGVGVACTIHVTALAREYMLRSSASLDIDGDGRVTVRSGLADAGTGQKTLVCQAVADVLGVDVGEVSIVTMDTARTDHDPGAGASRGSFVAVSTAKALAEKTRERLTDAAADKFHCDPGDVAWGDGGASYGDDALGIGDLAALAADLDGAFTETADFVADFHDPDPEGFEDISPTYSFAAHAVEVEVDERTGVVKVLKVVAAHDSGTILNPASARGQVEGGVVMGLGAALGESLIFEEGRVVNPSYSDYVIPRAQDAPPISTHFIETQDERGPFGAKGLGEIPLITIGPAVTNAVAHAIGVRPTAAPLTPDRILRAVLERDGMPTRAGSLGLDPRRWWVEALRRLYPLGVHAALRRLGPRLRATPDATRIEQVRTPGTKAEALQLLGSVSGAAPLAGGTDLMARETQQLPVPTVLVDVGRWADAAVRMRADGSLEIGGAATLSTLAAHDLVPTALRETATRIATPQIRNVATVVGNLCQAKRCWFFRNGFDCYKRGGATRPCYAVMGDHRFYHAVEGGHRCQAVTPSDLATTLTALDGRLVVEAGDRRREIAVADLYSGPGEVTLAQGEVVTAVILPPDALGRQTVYRKLALWEGAFAIATVCVSSDVADDGRIRDVRVVLGSVSPTPSRLRRVERLLVGRRADPGRIERGVRRWLRSTHPLAGNHWKAFAAANLLRSALTEATMRDGGGGR